MPTYREIAESFKAIEEAGCVISLTPVISYEDEARILFNGKDWVVSQKPRAEF